MQTISITAAKDGDRYAVLKDDADLSRFVAGAVETWGFEAKAEDTLSLIQTADRVLDFGLRRDESGAYSEASYRLAYVVSYVRVHVTAYTVSGNRTDQPTPEQIGALPYCLLEACYRKSQRGVDWDKILKKPEPDNPEPAETVSQDTILRDTTKE